MFAIQATKSQKQMLDQTTIVVNGWKRAKGKFLGNVLLSADFFQNLFFFIFKFF